MKKMHSDETLYECDTCQKKFRDKTQLKSHKVIHLPKEDSQRKESVISETRHLIVKNI